MWFYSINFDFFFILQSLRTRQRGQASLIKSNLQVKSIHIDCIVYSVYTMYILYIHFAISDIEKKIEHKRPYDSKD